VQRPRSKNRIRVEGLVQAAGGAVVGLLVYRFWSHTAGTVALGAASIVLATALLSPLGAFRFIEKMVAHLARLVGLILTQVLLTIIYVLVFTPIALWRRLRGRDALARTFDPAAVSYWRPRPETEPGLERWKHQF